MKLSLPTIIVDHREKKPFPFPEHLTTLNRDHPPSDRRTVVLPVRTKRAELPFGDYCLEGQAHVCAIERKANLGEIAWNLLTPDRRRATDAFRRLHDSCANPYLLIETDLLELNTPLRVPHSKDVFDPHAVVAALTDHIASMPRLRLLTFRANSYSRRLYAGTLVAHILLSHYPDSRHTHDSSPERLGPNEFQRPSSPKEAPG